ncbi:hypothetical protein [Dactylosporangium sp. NPDC048998]|uniref:hypothetical protein n=1 Tax=Dactylosporangium sp. NPDC048998 TaxID=3363976 RepID=UPI003710B626
MLYVVFDDTGRCLVSRDDPAPPGRAERADYDGVVAVRLTGTPGEDWARDAPDLQGTRLLTGSLLAIVVGATLTASALVTPWVALPAGAAATVYVGRRHNAAVARLERRWANRHRMLATRAEVARFRRAFDAARTVLVAWPLLAELVRIPSPRAEVSASLWTLAGLLHDHADLAEQYAGLSDARYGALPPDARVRAGLEDRLTRIDAAQRALSAEIDRRIESLTNLASRCAAFERTEAAPDEIRDLAERTAAIVSAYRELNGATQQQAG